jgi:hypothetical protein
MEQFIRTESITATKCVSGYSFKHVMHLAAIVAVVGIEMASRRLNDGQ